MNDKTPEQPATSDPGPDAADTTIQPEVPAGQTVAGAPADAADPAPVKKNRLAWVSSPKVAAATIITVLALGGLGGAFALGRATAGHDHGDRIMVRVPPGFDGPGMQGRGGGWVERGPMIERRRDLRDQAPEVNPSPSASGSSDG
jgi:hypothetical protein